MDRAALARRILSRRLRLKKVREDKPFESSAMGDLAFLLLIFFIVTSSFILRQGIFLSLPSRSAAVMRLAPDQIAEVFPRNNGFLYGGHLLTRDVFMKEMREFRKKNGKRVLIVSMSPAVKYDRLVDTLSVARETGIKRVSLKNLERE